MLLVKDYAAKLAGCVAFWLNPNFKPGDDIWIDGDRGRIVSIGLRDSTFGILNGRGYVWRIVPNDRIPWLKLEKVIDPTQHGDTDEESARRLARMLRQAPPDELRALVIKLREGELDQ